MTVLQPKPNATPEVTGCTANDCHGLLGLIQIDHVINVLCIKLHSKSTGRLELSFIVRHSVRQCWCVQCFQQKTLNIVPQQVLMLELK